MNSKEEEEEEGGRWKEKEDHPPGRHLCCGTDDFFPEPRLIPSSVRRKAVLLFTHRRQIESEEL